MTRFRCLASECEATCCGGWGIAVEPSAHRRLKVLAQGDTALSELLERGIEVTPAGPDYARLRFLPSGGCSMLDDAGLCSIHAKFGHDELFEVCAAYPRYANEVDGELELFGTLSCPEIARLALLADDAFELTSVTLEEPLRKLRNSFNTQRAYFQPFHLVRDGMLKLLAEPGYALSEKLFVLLWMSDKLRQVLHAGCAKVPETELKSIFSALAEAPVLGALTASFRGLRLDGALPLLVLHAALQPAKGAAGGAQTDRFDAILREVWGVFGLGRNPSDAELLTVWAAYGSRRATLPSSARARIDTCLTRYANNLPHGLARSPPPTARRKSNASAQLSIPLA